jgi:hypothetical protein
VEHGSGFFHGFITTPATIGFVNAIVASVLAAVAVVQVWNVSMDSVVPVISGGTVFVAAIATQAAFNIRSYARYSRHNQALFPPLERASGPGTPPTHD